jgi:hypothetical protein
MYVILDDHQCCCPCHYDGIPLCNCRDNCGFCDICHIDMAKKFIDDHIKECHESVNCVKCEINIHSEYIQLHLKFCKTRYGTKTKWTKLLK